MSANPEHVIWSLPVTKGFFKKTVVQERQITNYRAIQGTGYIGLQLLDDIIVMNQHRVSDSSYTSVGGGRYSPRVGTGKSTSRTVGDIAFIHEGKPYFIFYQIPDPQGVARLAKAARKSLLEAKKVAEKMNKAQLQEQQQQRQLEKQQQKEKISLEINTATTTTSNKVITCPRCSNTNTEGSKYCSNCGFRFADASREEEGTIRNQTPSPSSSSSPAPSLIIGEFVTWESPAHDVKINYPSNWTIEKVKKPSLVMFESPKESPSDITFENVVIGLYDIPNLTLEQLVPHYINQHRKRFVDFTPIESAATTLAGRQAHRIVFDTEGKRMLAVFTVGKNKVYDIVFASLPSKYDSYLAIVQKMLDSFVIM
ncbi:MAG: zinc ribbon domain-containing protein [Nitrososphaera sp.]